jgi:hypothetical protein
MCPNDEAYALVAKAKADLQRQLETNAFWVDVKNAYLKVAVDNGLEIQVERSGLRAWVGYWGDEARVCIVISEAETESTQPFIVP